MAQGISVALPLRIDPIDGAYGLNKEIESFAQQNGRASHGARIWCRYSSVTI